MKNKQKKFNPKKIIVVSIITLSIIILPHILLKSSTFLKASGNVPGSAIKSISTTQTNLEAEILEFLITEEYEESASVEEWMTIPEEWSDMIVTTEPIEKIPGTIEQAGDEHYVFIEGKLVDISKEESDADIALEKWMLDVRSFLIMR